ncbi:helix-turn-helix domain-containing protein [Rossellomorea vietnamensis]|uniref:helix-turn-helix domain-containing protein n=1 Tax=Rossellomorea vietnamensis TaxID=218284 RepID=UPI003CF38499
MSTLGNRLRMAREKKGWSQTEVCKKLKISNSTLSGYERDYRKPDTDMILTFANLYEVSTDYLLGNYIKEIPRDNFDPLEEINKLVKKYGIEQMGFFDIEEWKQLGPEDIRMLEEQFKLIVKMAKQKNKNKE